jgi:hypothetical protein
MTDEWNALDLRLDELMKDDEATLALTQMIDMLEESKIAPKDWTKTLAIGVAVMEQPVGQEILAASAESPEILTDKELRQRGKPATNPSRSPDMAKMTTPKLPKCVRDAFAAIGYATLDGEEEEIISVTLSAYNREVVEPLVEKAQAILDAAESYHESTGHNVEGASMQGCCDSICHAIQPLRAALTKWQNGGKE